MTTTSTAIALFRDWQLALAQYGDTYVARDLFFELSKQLGIVPWLEVEAWERAVEELHEAAWPDAASRPARLHTAPEHHRVTDPVSTEPYICARTASKRMVHTTYEAARSAMTTEGVIATTG